MKENDVFADLKAAVLDELENGTHTEAFADGARFTLQEAARMIAVTERDALEKLAARYEDLAGPEREFDENSIMSLREEARTGAYRLAARELRAVLESAVPQPVIDREALRRLAETAPEVRGPFGLPYKAVPADAVLALLNERMS